MTLYGNYFDPGVNDQHTITIDWGDGNQYIVTDWETDEQGRANFGFNHGYATGGRFDIVVTIADRDGLAVSKPLTVLVNGLRLTDYGTLQIVGSDNADLIDVRSVADDTRIRVTGDLSPEPHGHSSFEFARHDVSRIEVFACDGHDQILVGQNVNVETAIDGGAGDDLLQGGSGGNVILGGDGNDRIFGGSLRDVLVGGAGSDLLDGIEADDAVIQGVISDAAAAYLMKGGVSAWDDLRLPGDANEDGNFDEVDLMSIMRAAKYETGEAASWRDGDFNADGVVDSSDLLIALRTGRYADGEYLEDWQGFDRTAAEAPSVDSKSTLAADDVDDVMSTYAGER